MNDEDIIKSEDGLIFNPYNPLNTEITLNDVQFILKKYTKLLLKCHHLGMTLILSVLMKVLI